MNLNKVFILGRVTADIQLRTTPAGQSVANFNVATNRVWNNKSGGKQEETEFHTVVVWGRQAEVASQFLTKGSLVLIEGRLRTRSWQDKQGQNRKTTEIMCERMQLGPRPMGGGAQGKPVVAQPAAAADSPAEIDEIKPIEEIPVIDIDEDIKAEDLPF